MYLLRSTAVAALLLGPALAGSALADTPNPTGCNTAVSRAESEGGGVGYQPAPGQGARRAESEGGGVGSVNMATHKTESEGGGVGYQPAPGQGAQRAESEGGGVGSVNERTRLAMAEPCK